MGHGEYDIHSRLARSESLGYATASADEIFTNRALNEDMNPSGVTIRESRDSEEHPYSIPIIIGLDVTGSMGHIPHHLVKEGLPHMMDNIIQKGIADPQVLFMGIGDHECDGAPLQIGQFESSDELLDNWLTNLWIEGGGGGNLGESYLLAWFFASQFTRTDHAERRNQKGLLFTIGDEPTLSNLPSEAQKTIMGPGQYQSLTAVELLAAARENYEVYHLHIQEASHGRSQNVTNGWRDLIGGDNLLIVQNKNDIANLIADITLRVTTAQGVIPSTASNDLDIEDERFADIAE